MINPGFQHFLVFGFSFLFFFFFFFSVMRACIYVMKRDGTSDLSPYANNGIAGLGGRAWT